MILPDWCEPHSTILPVQSERDKMQTPIGACALFGNGNLLAKGKVT